MSEQNTPVPGTPDSGTPQGTPPEPTPLALKDDQIIDWNGEKLSVKDLRSRTMMHADYTKKTQEVAEARRQWEAEQAAKAAEFADFENKKKQFFEDLKDERKAVAYVLAAQRSKFEAEQEPKPLTTANLPTIQQHLAKLVQDEVNTRLSSYDQMQAQQKAFNDLTEYTKGLLSKHEDFDDMDGYENVVMQRAGARYGNQGNFDMNKAKAVIQDVVQEQLAAREAKRTERAKQREIEKKRPVEIEPTGGRFPKAEKKTYKGPDDPARWNDFEAFLGEHLVDESHKAR